MGWLYKVYQKRNERTLEKSYPNPDEFHVYIHLKYDTVNKSDIEKDSIYNKLEKFFENYFQKNPVNDKVYTGLEMTQSKYLTEKYCTLDIIFEGNIIEFLSNEDINLWKKQIITVSSLASQHISNFVYWNTNDRKSHLKKQMDFIDKFMKDK